MIHIEDRVSEIEDRTAVGDQLFRYTLKTEELGKWIRQLLDDK